MSKLLNIALVLSLLLLSGCRPPMLYPIDGASTENTASVVRIREGSMLLRGLDGKPLDTMKLPNPFSDYLFVLNPGTHSLWGMNIQGGHALFPEALRCYVITEVDLKAGIIYRLNEDKEVRRVFLTREDTGAEVAVGKLVDQKAAFTDSCDWKKIPK